MSSRLDTTSIVLDVTGDPSLDRLREARVARQESEVEFRAAVVNAYHESDDTVDGIATVAGISRARVYQIVSEEER